MAGRAEGSTRQTDTRILQIPAAALELFTSNSVAGTSLQMIGDRLGLTKAALFYHFENREQLVLAVMEPYFAELRQTVDAAQRRRSATARADAMICGYAELAAHNRAVAGVLALDVAVTNVLMSQPEWADLIRRQVATLVGADPGRADLIKAHAVFRGLAGAAMGAPADIGEEELRELLTEVGRRMWGLRVPRRAEPGG